MQLCGNSLLVELPVQPEEGGSIPTLPLHKLLRVEECNPRHVNWFIKRKHYSKSIFGITASVCFRVLCRDKICGAAIFGLPAGMGVAQKYGSGKNLLELRRFVLDDWLPKNSESFCLGVMLRTLKKKGIARILSYADPVFGHSGIIYAAAGFEKIGTTARRRHVVWKGKKYPDRNIHQTNFPFHRDLRSALQNGEATWIDIPSKIIWLKRLDIDA